MYKLVILHMLTGKKNSATLEERSFAIAVRGFFHELQRKTRNLLIYSLNITLHLFVHCVATFAVQSSQTQYNRRRQRNSATDNIKIQNWRRSPSNQVSGCPGRRTDIQLCCRSIKQRFTRLEIAYVSRETDSQSVS